MNAIVPVTGALGGDEGQAGEAGVRHRPRLRGQSTVSLAEVPRTLATLIPFWWSHLWEEDRRAA